MLHTTASPKPDLTTGPKPLDPPSSEFGFPSKARYGRRSAHGSSGPCSLSPTASLTALATFRAKTLPAGGATKGSGSQAIARLRRPCGRASACLSRPLVAWFPRQSGKAHGINSSHAGRQTKESSRLTSRRVIVREYPQANPVLSLLCSRQKRIR